MLVDEEEAVWEPSGTGELDPRQSLAPFVECLQKCDQIKKSAKISDLLEPLEDLVSYFGCSTGEEDLSYSAEYTKKLHQLAFSSRS